MEVNCDFEQGKTLVMPAINGPCLAEVGNSATSEQPLFTSGKYQQFVNGLDPQSPQAYFTVKFTLDGEDMPAPDVIVTKGATKLSDIYDKKQCVPDFLLGDYRPQTGYVVGPYAFIDTSDLECGPHTVVLIGSNTYGFCSAVKLIFDLTCDEIAI